MIHRENRDTQGLTYCRPDKKRMPLTARTSKNYCPCGFKIRGKNHNEGKHHINSPLIKAQKQKDVELTLKFAKSKINNKY